MWGWKTLEFSIDPAIQDDQVLAVLKQHGFVITTTAPHGIDFQRAAGKPVAVLVNAKYLVAAQPRTLQLKYGTFIAFDTGDLRRFGENLLEAIQQTRVKPIQPEAASPYAAILNTAKRKT